MKKSLLVGCTSAVLALQGCVPVERSEKQLVGKWHVTLPCGTEHLELKEDLTYVQAIDYAGGGHATHSGTWRVTASRDRLEGAKVVLSDALEYCSGPGDRLSQPKQGDRNLEMIWEWGRVILSFNPDVQGFQR